MQPMPAKNRTAILLGAAVLAVLVGTFAMWSSRQDARPMENETAQGNGAGQPAQTAHSTDPANSGLLGGLNPATAGETGTPATGTGTGMQVQPLQFQVPEYHVVQANETLYDISRMYYNDYKYAGDIEELNGLGNPDDIKVGMRLMLPRPESLAGMEPALPVSGSETGTSTETESTGN